MRGLTLRVTNTSLTVQVIVDLPAQAVLVPGEIRELLYTDEVQSSLEYGSINNLLVAAKITAQFVSGTDLSQAPIGRMFTGATPTQVGIRGLVPTASPTERAFYLKGDGTWSNVTPFGIGAVPESKLTAQGDLLVRGVTTSERLPIGNLGDALRVGLIGPQWQDVSLAGLLAARPAPSAFYAGVLFYATDATTLEICYDNGAGYAWGLTGGGGGGGNGGWDTFPTGGSPTFPGDITHIGRASVGVLPSSAIKAGIQFEVLGASFLTKAFVSETTFDADQAGATQLRADALDGGLYVRPEGQTERRADLPSLARKLIPAGETVIIPNGSQYICSDSITLAAGATLVLQGDADLVVLDNGTDAPGLTRKFIPAGEIVTVPNGHQYLVYETLTFGLGASMVLQGDADLVILAYPPGTGVPGLTRKFIPAGEAVTVPNGSQYLVYGAITLGLGASLTLQGDADLVILAYPSVTAELLTVLTGNGEILYRDGAGAVAALPVGADGDLLTLSGGLPQWAPPPWTTSVPPTTVATTNATVTPLLVLATTPNKGHALDLLVSATRDDRSAQVAWKVLAAVTRDGGGTVTVRSVLATPSGVTPWVVNVTAVGLTIVVTVQGAAATNIDWITSGSLLV